MPRLQKKKYKAAIVGLGRIASLFADDKKRSGIVTHAQAYAAHPKTELVAACDLNPERLEAFGKRWGVENLYTDLNKMLSVEKLDILSVCTWNTTHASIVEQAVRSGVRGLICEKPIADNLRSAERIVRLCRSKKVPLLVNYFRRYNPLHRKIKKFIEKGSLGEIQTVSCYYTAGLLNTGTHLFDLLLYCFGDVEWVWANSQRVLPGDDPTADLYLYFKKGFGCAVHGLDVKKYTIFEIDIYGSLGRLRIADTGMRAEFWKVVKHPNFSGYNKLAEGRGLSTDFSRDMYRLVDDLVVSLEIKKEPDCSGVDGKKSLEVALAAKLSIQKKRKIVLPLKV